LSRSLILAAAAMLLTAQVAFGQASSGPGQSGTGESSSAATPAANGANPSPVTVTGARAAYQREADKKVYALSADPLLANESIGEALQNIPSVDVNPQGVVSLRGDSNVTILVDGQPSPMFQGPSRAQLLQSLPANQYDRVEVMTNPSAAYSPEGTGGVINLITKKGHAAAKPTGEISASVDTLGGYRAGFNGTYPVNDRLSLSGTANVFRQVRQTDTRSSEQITDPVSGETASVSNNSRGLMNLTVGQLRGGADYQLDATTRLSTFLDYYDYSEVTDLAGAYSSSATSGPLAVDYDTLGRQPWNGSGVNGSTSVVHELGGDDHQVSVASSYSLDWTKTGAPQTLSFSIPPGPNLFQNLVSGDVQDEASLKAEYKGPLPGGGKLDTGYELKFERYAEEDAELAGESQDDAAPVPSLADRYRYEQTIHALFATYEQPVGAFDIKPGIRLEEAIIDVDDLSDGLKSGSQYFQAYPSLSVVYRLSKDKTLTASYSRKVKRPSAGQLDPFFYENNPQSFGQGNSHLSPAFTDSYELEYAVDKGPNHYDADLYYKDTRGLVSPITEALTGGALLNTFANVGESQQTGVELIATQQVGKTLTIKLTGDASWMTMSNLPLTESSGNRSGVAVSGKATAEWAPTASDFLQVQGYAWGPHVTAQGHDAAFAYAYIGYRHQFPNRLALEVKILDPFETFRYGEVTETPTLKLRSISVPHLSSLSIGFSYPLGGVAKAVQRDFDFNSNPGPSPH
jgi:outer membrane receptor protein involved in Fe transport